MGGMRTLGSNTGARLIVYGDDALSVLPQTFMVALGEGLGDEGKDCWIASIEVKVDYLH